LASKKRPETQKKANKHELGCNELAKVRKIKEDPDFEGSDLGEDQSPCVKNLFFMETNHICTELSRKPESQRILRPEMDTSASLGWIGQILFANFNNGETKDIGPIRKCKIHEDVWTTFDSESCHFWPPFWDSRCCKKKPLTLLVLMKNAFERFSILSIALASSIF
jgi:hypothetical protein